MKFISERLSSLKLAMVILSVLVFWLAWGILLADSDAQSSGFRIMNGTLAPEWFKKPDAVSMLLKTWFLGLCLFMGLLGVNLVFCSWNRMVLMMGNRRLKSKIVMLAVHVVFGLVALGHLGSFLLGYRYENIRLAEGETFRLPNGDALILTNVHFADDPRVLRKKPWQLRSQEYHPEMNVVSAVLKRNGVPVSEGRISYLNPLSHGDIQITLKRFTLPRQKKTGRSESLKPDVLLILTRNPLKRGVFTLFPMMIAGIIIYTVMTWRRPLKNGMDKSTGGKR